MRGPPALSGVAAVTQRLAVLLAAGVAPASAWGYVAQGTSGVVPTAVVAGDANRIAQSIVAASSSLSPLEAQGWRGLAAAWSVAADAGAPLAPSLRDYAASLRDLAQVQRDFAVALAAPVATARVVVALPAVGLLFGLAMGFDTLGVLFGTAPGWVCLALGAGLIAGALAWNRRLVASAQPTDANPGLACELMAIAVSGGGSLERARSLVDRALAECDVRADQKGIDAVLELSRRAGVPAAELLRSEADEQRRSARSHAQERAASLSVRLMLPLGLCILPAFMLLGVVPLLVSVISSTVGSF